MSLILLGQFPYGKVGMIIPIHSGTEMSLFGKRPGMTHNASNQLIQPFSYCDCYIVIVMVLLLWVDVYCEVPKVSSIETHRQINGQSGYNRPIVVVTMIQSQGSSGHVYFK